MATLKKVIAEIELDKLFNVFNTKYFNDEIRKPVIAVQTNGRDRQVMGWCSTRKCWRDKEKNEDYYEITICAEYLNRGIEEICSTLLHEMVHLNNLQKKIKDTSRGGAYHNKRFKAEAEKCGLTVSYDKRIGWSISKLNDEGRKLVGSIIIDESAFTLSRRINEMLISTPNGTDGGDEEGNPPPQKTKQSFRKYICPSCGMIVRATKDVNVVCGDCDEQMVKEEA